MNRAVANIYHFLIKLCVCQDILKSFPFITTYSLQADAFESLSDSLPHLTILKIFKFDASQKLNFYKCLNLQTLFLFASGRPDFVKIPALFEMPHLSKLSLYRVTIAKCSPRALDGLSSLQMLKLNQCAVMCDWSDLGVSLSKVPLESLILFKVECDVKQVQQLLKCIVLPYLRIFLRGPAAHHRWSPSYKLFESFNHAFSSKHCNPRSFLIERRGAHNLNGVVFID